MTRFKRTLKKVGLIILIVLAATGIGLFGAVPIIPSNKRKETVFKIELVEDKKEDENAETKELERR